MHENLKQFENVQANDLSKLDERLLLIGFTQNVWEEMNGEERLCLLQEVENRRAMADGRPPVKVKGSSEFSPQTLGGYCDDGGEAIYINSRFLEKERLNVFSGAAALNTVLHEGRHAFQNHAVREGRVNVSELLRQEWAATQEMYEHDDYLFYSLQTIEMDARRFARRMTVQFNEFLCKAGVVDTGFAIQAIHDLKRENEIIWGVRTKLTREKLDQYEKKVLDHFQKAHPELDVKRLRLFDHARFILDHPEITDPRKMLERLDRMADEQLALQEVKRLNRVAASGLNALKV